MKSKQVNMKSKQVKVWITKYALTRGILECKAEYNEDYPGMILIKGNGPCTANAYYHGCDWHLTEIGAKSRASEMIDSKIECLKKQIAKLEGMKRSGVRITDYKAEVCEEEE